jgi:ribosomal protein L40E
MEHSYITCRNCGGENPSDARFCIECSESLMSATGPTTKLVTPTCTACGAENLPDARFCAMCGRSLPATVAVGTPWVQPQVAPHSSVRPSAPRRVPVVTPPKPPVSAPQAAFPRTMTPPALPQIPSQPRSHGHHHRHHRHHGGHGSAKVVLIFGIIALMVLKLATWPLIMLVLGAAFLVHQAERGRLEQALKGAAIVGAIALVANNPRMWPLIIVGIVLMKIVGSSKKW